jgi:hypothetical protein
MIKKSKNQNLSPCRPKNYKITHMQPYFSEIPRMHPNYLLSLDIKISMKK